MNQYTVTISDGTAVDTQSAAAPSHVDAAILSLLHTQAAFSNLNDAATLTITVSRP